jgi:hypothetical protein
VLRLRKSDVKAPFAVAYAFQKKLQRDGGLAGAGVSFKKVKMTGRESAPKNVV